MQLTVGFHCTRVKGPTREDWIKLKKLFGCIWKTPYFPLIAVIDQNGDVIIYIDGDHVVHADSKGHAGLFLTMGKGAMVNVSKKLGVVTTSCTETEVMSNGERFLKCTWFQCFRIAQGEEGKEDESLQDNKSCILLHKNYPFLQTKDPSTSTYDDSLQQKNSEEGGEDCALPDRGDGSRLHQ